MSLHDATSCPDCGASWLAGEIPADSRHHYGGKTHFRRVIAIEYDYSNPMRYDGVSEWRCPDCGARFGRWTERRLEDGMYEPPFGRVAAA
jgi:predicted RNA-binding Zn-ribbon protein involved in translation (DUF1610 family)